MASSTAASVASASLCEHGRRGPCRWVNPAGQGCKWGDGCHFCHVCRRVTTYNRIQQALASRRQSKSERVISALPEVVGFDLLREQGQSRSLEISDSASSLSSLIGCCPELLLEGTLGEALPLNTLAALACVHIALGKLMTGGSSLVLWRLQFKRICAAGIHLADTVIEAFSLPELRRSTRALGSLHLKGVWHLESEEEVRSAVEAVEAARAGSPLGTSLFALACAYGSEDEDFEQVVFLEPTQGPPICLPDGWQFRISLLLTNRPVTSRHISLQPVLLGFEVNGAPVLKCEAWLWSASPSVCAFQELALWEDRRISSAEAAALLGTRPRTLHVVAAVRCVQRFWELTLT